MALIRIAGYPMDLALTEGHTFPGEVTKYPVEQGADVSDHIRDLPPEITLECIVSDDPIGDIANDPTRQSLAGEFVLPSGDALEKLRELKALRRPVSIETSLGVFESMAFESLEVPRDKDKNNGLFFTAKFTKFVSVTNRRVKVRVKTPMAGAGGKSKVKAVVGKTVTVIDDTVVWRHGTPPGAPFRGGLSEIVEVSYSKPAGLSRSEAIALGPANVASQFVTYFHAGAATPIVGAERIALQQDLARDAAEKREAQGKALNLGPNASLRQAQNLPEGLDLSRFQRPAPEPTLGPSAKDLDFSRFSQERAPTFPPTFNGVP